MDKILNSIYLKVKSETKTLTNSAIAQILVKLYIRVKNDYHITILFYDIKILQKESL